jgi:hypothetical protein
MTNATQAPAVALKHQPQIPAALLDQAERDAGRGVSHRPEDSILPLIYVEQTGSPHVDKRSPDYIEGDAPGNFRLSNAPNPIRNGVEGIEVIPCEMRRVFIEWRPNRQGFVAEHAEMPADAVPKIIFDGDGKQREKLVRSSGNILEETRQFYLLLDGMPYVLPCAGTKNTFAKKWNDYFKQLRHPKTGGGLPSYIHKYRCPIATHWAIGSACGSRTSAR